MQIDQYYPNRTSSEILADVLKDKLAVRNGIPIDKYGRKDFEMCLPLLAKNLVLHEVFINSNEWVLDRILGEINVNPRDAVIQYVNDLTTSYVEDAIKQYSRSRIEKIDLIYAIFSLPQYTKAAIDVTVNLYMPEFSKIVEKIDNIIGLAKSDDKHKTERIFQKIAELYVSQLLDDSSAFIFAVMYSMYRTMEEDFLIPSLCMYSPELMVYGRTKKLTSVEKVITRLSTGSSNPYDTQKIPDATPKSFIYAQSQLSQIDAADHWIVKKYLKKRRDILYNTLGISEEEAKNGLFEQKLFNLNEKWINLLCENFHIPHDDFMEMLEFWHSQESLDMRESFVRGCVDSYFAIKLRDILDTMSEEELEQVTTRDIIGSIGMEDIDNDIAHFKQILLIFTLFRLANKYRCDYYSIYNFSSSRENNNALGKSYQRALAECRSELEQKNKIIEKYQSQEKKREIRKSKDTEKPLLAEISSLKNIVSKKDQEIEDLKAQLEEAKEYYNLLDQSNKDPQEDETKNYDLSVLDNKKIAFVCNDIDSEFPTLRKLFPGSVLVSTDTTQARAKNVDLVVFFTKYISHSIYFKTKKLYKDVPSYAYNRANIADLKKELAKYFSER